MNILCVIDNLGSGGAQRQLVNLARGMQKRGHSVEFFTYHPQNHYQPLLSEVGIHINHCCKRTRYSLVPLIALRKLIQRRHFDVVLSFLDTPNFYAEFSCLGLRKKPKLIVSERFMYPQGKLPLNLRLLQECHRLADAITVNSHHQRIRMEREFLWMVKKLRTIYNGFDLDTYQPSTIEPVPSGRTSLLAIASVAYKKNSLNLAKALALCKAHHGIEVMVDWVGTNQVSGEGTLPQEETAKFLTEHGISHLWRWLGERDDIAELLATHDALVHPSFFEGLPNVVCEALACGRPVLLSRICDHPLLVQEAVSGFLFDPSSPEDIVRVILNFSQTSPLERQVMGQHARRFAKDKLSLERFLVEYENLMMTVVKGHGEGL